MAETKEKTEKAAGRGRPRPQDVIDRDAQVLAAIPPDGATKGELAEALSIEPSAVYLSLFRLRKDGKVKPASGDGESKRTRRWVTT